LDDGADMPVCSDSAVVIQSSRLRPERRAASSAASRASSSRPSRLVTLRLIASFENLERVRAAQQSQAAPAGGRELTESLSRSRHQSRRTELLADAVKNELRSARENPDPPPAASLAGLPSVTSPKVGSYSLCVIFWFIEKTGPQNICR
jgi:hypothetical protein